MTVRDRVAAIQRRVLTEAVTPKLASEMESQLSALLGYILHAVTDAQIAFNETLMECYAREAKANRARILAETTPQFRALREAKDAHAMAVEMIRSLRQMQRMYSEEMRLQR